MTIIFAECPALEDFYRGAAETSNWLFATYDGNVTLHANDVSFENCRTRLNSMLTVLNGLHIRTIIINDVGSV